MIFHLLECFVCNGLIPAYQETVAGESAIRTDFVVLPSPKLVVGRSYDYRRRRLLP